MNKFNLKDIIKAYELGKSHSKIEKEDKVIFHGGCINCVSQERFGLERCYGCQFQKPDWNLPDKSIKKDE